MALYEVLKKHFILEPIVKDLMKMALVIESKAGKDVVRRGPFKAPAFENPWIFSGTVSGRNCYLWRDIYLYKYGLISRNCLNCWKVVVRTNHLTNLIQINKLQIEMHKEDPKKFNGKCGMETRPWCTHKGRYAAFWYGSMFENDPFVAGMFLVKEVEKRVRDLGIRDKVILKRGCTE